MIAWTLAAMAFVAPPLAIYAPLGMAPLVAVGAALVGLAFAIDRRRPQVPGKTGFALFAGLILWGLITWFWSVNPSGTIKTALQLTGIWISAALLLAGAQTLDAARARRVMAALIAGIALALLVYAIERAFGSPIQWLFRERAGALETIYSPFNRGLSVLLATMSPALIALWCVGRRAVAFALGIIGVLTIYAYYGSSAQVAVSLGLAALAVALIRPNFSIRALGILTALSVLAAPFIARATITPAAIDWTSTHTTNFSLVHRLVIWQFAADRIDDRPVLGWGLDASRAMPGGQQERPIRMGDLKPDKEPSFGQLLPLHPHNATLQWWLELGLPGTAVGAAFILWLYGRIADLATSRAIRALLGAQLTAVIIVANLSFGSWQSWWLSTLVIGLALSLIAFRISAGHDENRAYLKIDARFVSAGHESTAKHG